MARRDVGDPDHREHQGDRLRVGPAGPMDRRPGADDQRRAGAGRLRRPADRAAAAALEPDDDPGARAGRPAGDDRRPSASGPWSRSSRCWSASTSRSATWPGWARTSRSSGPTWTGSTTCATARSTRSSAGRRPCRRAGRQRVAGGPATAERAGRVPPRHVRLQPDGRGAADQGVLVHRRAGPADRPGGQLGQRQVDDRPAAGGAVSALERPDPLRRPAARSHPARGLRQTRWRWWTRRSACSRGRCATT